MQNELKRDLKIPGAILMGLGSIIGTGIFVSIAIATQISGNGIVIAIVIAAILATFNGLSSAQLAAVTAVLGCVGYLFYAFDIGASNRGIVAAGLLLLLIITYLVSRGISRSNRANKYIVTTTIIGLDCWRKSIPIPKGPPCRFG